jgi:hypothetical protein
MANNAFPYSFFGAARVTVSETAAREQVSAAQQSGLSRRPATLGCSGFRDIHKNLWASLWIVYE